jgi:hypothetical protein
LIYRSSPQLLVLLEEEGPFGGDERRINRHFFRALTGVSELVTEPRR